MSDEPAAILVDTDGVPIGVLGNPLIVNTDTLGLTDAQIRATALPISVASLPMPSGAATQSTLVAILARQADGSQRTAIDNFPSTQAVTGPVTDAQLRATALPVSGPATDTQLRATPLPISATNIDVAISTRTKPSDQQHAIIDISALPLGASTEATLALIKAKTDNIDVALSTRAVTGLTDTQIRTTPLPVSGPATDTQLRATPLPVSAANLDVALSTRTKPSDQQHAIIDSSALPSGASTEATLALIKAKTDNLDVALSTRTKPADTQAISAVALPLPSGAATSAKQDLALTQLQIINSLVPAVFDYITLGYTGDDLTTVTYKTGGAGGSVVSTLTLAYTASVLQSVTKT